MPIEGTYAAGVGGAASSGGQMRAGSDARPQIVSSSAPNIHPVAEQSSRFATHLLQPVSAAAQRALNYSSSLVPPDKLTLMRQASSYIRSPYLFSRRVDPHLPHIAADASWAGMWSGHGSNLEAADTLDVFMNVLREKESRFDNPNDLFTFFIYANPCYHIKTDADYQQLIQHRYVTQGPTPQNELGAIGGVGWYVRDTFIPQHPFTHDQEGNEIDNPDYRIPRNKLIAALDIKKLNVYFGTIERNDNNNKYLNFDIPSIINRHVTEAIESEVVELKPFISRIVLDIAGFLLGFRIVPQSSYYESNKDLFDNTFEKLGSPKLGMNAKEAKKVSRELEKRWNKLTLEMIGDNFDSVPHSSIFMDYWKQVFGESFPFPNSFSELQCIGSAGSPEEKGKLEKFVRIISDFQLVSSETTIHVYDLLLREFKNRNDLVKNIRAELPAKNLALTWNNFGKCAHLQDAIFEALRVYGPAEVLTWEVFRHGLLIERSGRVHGIPKGAILFADLGQIDALSVENGSEFVPGRRLEKDSVLAIRTNKEIKAFSGGSVSGPASASGGAFRICPGRYFATLEMGAITKILLQRCNIFNSDKDGNILAAKASTAIASASTKQPAESSYMRLIPR